MNYSHFFIYLFCVTLLALSSCNPDKKKAENTDDPAQNQANTEIAEILSAESLGLAYLEENDLENAEKQFKRYIELAPNDAAGYANLGVVYLRQNRNDDAEKILQKAVELAPEDPDIRLNLAKVYELKNNQEASLQELKKNEEIAPDHVKTLYSLAEQFEGSADAQSLLQWESYMQKVVDKSPRNIVARLYLIEALLRNNKADEALKNLEEAQQIYPAFPAEAMEYFNKSVTQLREKKPSEALTSILIFHNFLKLTPEYRSGVSELKGAQGSVTGTPIISMNQGSATGLNEGENILEIMKFTDATQSAGLDFYGNGILDVEIPYTSNIAVGDMDEDGDQDIYFSGYESNGDNAFNMLLFGEYGRYRDIAAGAGLSHGGKDNSSRLADVDNDGFPDLFICNSDANVLYRNVSEGVFSNISEQSGIIGNGNKSLFMDLDHEGDLDIIVGRNGKNQVLRNDGTGTFTESDVLQGPIYNTKDLAFLDFDNDGDLDLVLANSDGPVQLFSNLRQGEFKDVTKQSEINVQSTNATDIADYDNDGLSDVILSSVSNGINLYHNKGDGTFEISPLSDIINHYCDSIHVLDIAFLDFDNDGFSDIFIVGETSSEEDRAVRLLHNERNGFSEATFLIPENITNGRQIALADYNGDGDTDIFIVETTGGLKLLRNDGGNANRHLKIQLVGLRTGSGKNNYFGIGAKVEVRAGDLYQMKLITEPGLHFGLGQREKADVVRILWTNGVPQNIFSPGSDQDLIETQELKGSCPFLYTWNGEEYVFIKDMMWRSALGMPTGIMGGKTAYAFADASEEYLKIPGELLQEKDGLFTIQMTEELWETIYCDEIKLIAVDHPADVDIYVDEKFAAPPYPELKVFNVKNHQLPITVRDEKGNDLLGVVNKKDDHYISNFQKGSYQGITEMKDLILDLGDVRNTKNLHLFLNGWIFPTDASINTAISQSDNLKIKPPSLEVINSEGAWQEVIPNIGFPSGKNKTVIADLSDVFLTAERKVRIRTNMEIYWDYIFFAQNEDVDISLTTMNPASANHHYRGFSRSFRKEGRYGPHWFDYGEVSTGQKWRDLTGSYTRYGDVNELLQQADDMYIIANAGDETTITFDSRKLPKLREGRKRDFLIYSIGWVKDGDLNTALGQTVTPLPFHDMSRYPYGKNEQYPTDRKHREYLEKYNTRVVGTDQFEEYLLRADK